jgi:hypothetical protein
MLRLYLDTNLLTKLDKAEHSQLKALLLKYADYLNIVYSSAHISDLEKSSNAELTLKDLNTIRFYTNNQCLAKYWGIENLSYDIRDPIEFFETSKETTIDVESAFKNIENECQKLGIESPFERLKKLNTKMDFDVTNEVDQSSFFRRFKEEQTFSSLFEDVKDILQASLTSNLLLKEVRTHFDKHLPREVMGNVKEDIIGYLNQELPKTIFNKTFDDLTNNSLKLSNKRQHSDFDRFVTRYCILDLVGYKSDNTSTTPNIIADGSHAFYAAHCDIFISQDKRLRDKAKIIYNEFGVDTPIFSEKEFCESIDRIILKIQDTSTFTDIISKISSLNVESFYSVIDTKSTVREYFLGTFFAGYFNYVIWVSTIDDNYIIAFTKDLRTLSNWFYYKELKTLVKSFVEWLGPDIHNRSEFVDESQEFSQDGIWIGRAWVFEKILITLTKHSDLGFVFQIESFKD